MMMLRYLFLFLICFINQKVYTQPGDHNGQIRYRYVQEIRDSIKLYPNNCAYRWAQVDLLFHPNITLYTPQERTLKEYTQKSTGGLPDSIDVFVPQPCDMCPNRIKKIANPELVMKQLLLHEVDLIKELTYLIEMNCQPQPSALPSVGMYKQSATLADFYFKRGQAYYFTAKSFEALNDFKMALLLTKDQDLKEEICLAIAAYYYNLSGTPVVTNSLKALAYIDSVTPTQYDTVPRDMSQYNERHHDRFEREKIVLLKVTYNTQRYIGYLNNLSKSYRELYLKLLSETLSKEWNVWTITECINRADYYELQIFRYIKEMHPDYTPEQWLEEFKRVDNTY